MCVQSYLFPGNQTFLITPPVQYISKYLHIYFQNRSRTGLLSFSPCSIILDHDIIIFIWNVCNISLMVPLIPPFLSNLLFWFLKGVRQIMWLCNWNSSNYFHLAQSASLSHYSNQLDPSWTDSPLLSLTHLHPSLGFNYNGNLFTPCTWETWSYLRVFTSAVLSDQKVFYLLTYLP